MYFGCFHKCGENHLKAMHEMTKMSIFTSDRFVTSTTNRSAVVKVGVVVINVQQ